MNWEKLAVELTKQTDSKIVLLVMDGLGGLPVNGRTELQAARTPNLDRLASEGACGLTDPVSPGITPGSGPSHLALFGYDPIDHILGRGILEAMGVGVMVGKDDMVARGNFATLRGGQITDRRAGRIPTKENTEICRKINSEIHSIDGAQIEVYPGMEHRFVVKFSREDLNDSLSDADPQQENKPPVPTVGLVSESAPSAELVNRFIDRVTDLLKDNPKANTILLRGFSKHPCIPSLGDLYKLRPAAIANYPMYKGLAKIVGMDILEVGDTMDDLFSALERHYDDHDFFYIHVKKTDSYGEDGNFDGKVGIIEQTDQYIPRILDLNPSVLAVTSDHSTPSLIKAHSWHPNPLVIHSRMVQVDRTAHFSEQDCSQGYFGRFAATHVMPLLLAHSGKLQKYGA
ncbi:2,3-bisphosphoglycerate-independent phosphoglycerate mutase [Acidobacteriota bacterium]